MNPLPAPVVLNLTAFTSPVGSVIVPVLSKKLKSPVIKLIEISPEVLPVVGHVASVAAGPQFEPLSSESEA